MVLATLLLSLFLGSAVGDSSMSAPRTPDYWEAWGVVFVKAKCDADGRVLHAEFARGGAPAVLDSLVALVEAGAFAVRTRWDGRIRSRWCRSLSKHHAASERAVWVSVPEDIRGCWRIRRSMRVEVLAIDPGSTWTTFCSDPRVAFGNHMSGYLASPT
jgi:hypothetical protein